MLRGLFGKQRNANRRIVEALYEQIVAAARQPFPYSAWQVPDTPLGRFEMLSLVMFLFLRRVRGEDGAMRDVAQLLTDEFFRDVEHSIRELGIGDLGVPKRMKKLARMFYGRVASYGEALDGEDAAALAEALRRNVRPDSPTWPQAASLAGHATRIAEALQGQRVADFAAGKVAFPLAVTVQEPSA
jgi:cytochrome b pre-mRNA-processing protein 3